ncbi:MAG: succinate dehydrogenase, cytochrome b556 subunit [Alphaproteobacteria bacterium]|nr:succinate dehydrogenase, cytochrome b556 subunit [Alphaproteobacteria bacterium]
MSLSSPQPPSSRPLAPHLQIYRPQLTSILSIMHRLTGMGLSCGALLIVVWLGALAMGQEHYYGVTGWLSSPLGTTLLFGWAFCFYFHFANGIRHLFWDMGWGYELKTVYRSGWIVVCSAFGFTLLTFWKILYHS